MSDSNRSTESSGAGADDAELEFMCQDDSSWHPCHVTLCETGLGLIVNYENADSGDIVLNGQEALRGLRMRSVPLNDDDCVHIQEGDHILATEKLQTNCLFYDAAVEKALKIRHSKRSPCRCTFKIKWLHRDLDEKTSTVTASSIMKLATKSVNEHPTMCSFLQKLKNLKCSTSPVLNIENDIDIEMDLHELLERQIEVISNSVDVSKKKFVKDFQLGIKFNNKGEIQCSAVAKPEVTKPSVLVPSDSTTPQRTSRSGRKLQNIKKLNPPPPPPPNSFVHEELPEIPLLNPLAARAAFASLMSKVPQEGKFSAKLDFMQSLYETESLNCPNICPQTTTSVSYEPQSFSSEISDITPSLNSSAAKRELSPPLPPDAAKIARSSIAKDSIHRETRFGNKKLVSPNSLSRVTRSAARNVNESQTMDDIQGAGDEECRSNTLNNSSYNNLKDTQKSDLVAKKILGEKKGTELEDQLNTSAGLMKPTMTGRLTRSKVLERKSQTVEAAYVLKASKFAESTTSTSFEGKGSASNGNVSSERTSSAKLLAVLKVKKLRRTIFHQRGTNCEDLLGLAHKRTNL